MMEALLAPFLINFNNKIDSLEMTLGKRLSDTQDRIVGQMRSHNALSTLRKPANTYALGLMLVLLTVINRKGVEAGERATALFRLQIRLFRSEQPWPGHPRNYCLHSTGVRSISRFPERGQSRRNQASRWVEVRRGPDLSTKASRTIACGLKRLNIVQSNNKISFVIPLTPFTLL
jgi:hypothetical protein